MSVVSKEQLPNHGISAPVKSLNLMKTLWTLAEGMDKWEDYSIKVLNKICHSFYKSFNGWENKSCF